jgi:hypothetical protein
MLDNKNRKVNITKNQMDLIHDLKNKSDKIIAFSFIYINNIFVSSPNDEFDLSNSTLQHLTLFSDEQIRTVYNILIVKQYIDCIYRDKLNPISDISKRKYRVNKLKNRFKLNLLNTSDEVIYTFGYIDTRINNILYDFYNCYYQYLVNNKINIPRRTKDNINKYVLNRTKED